MLPVDQTTNKVVLKPGFQNRRTHSVHLKNAFPAGFRPQQSKSSANLENHGPVVNDSILNQSVGGVNKSYMSWTKGGDNDGNVHFSDDYDTFENSNILSDPMANMAGPFYSDMMRAKANDASKFKNTIDANSLICSIESHEIFLQERNPQDAIEEKKRNKNHVNTKVYHAPSSLPTFPTKLTNNKLLTTQQYGQWLDAKRNNNDEKAWHIKGNNDNFNYSAHNFNGGELNSSGSLASFNHYVNSKSLALTLPEDQQEEDFSHSLNLSPNSKFTLHSGAASAKFNDSLLHNTSLASNNSKSIFSDLPSLILPNKITIEIYTQNQLVKSKTVLSDKQYIVKTVTSDISLLEIKSIIIEEIIFGIEKAFRLTDTLTTGRENSGISNIDTKQIDLLFSYYNTVSGSWKGMKSEHDWITAKMNTCGSAAPVPDVTLTTVNHSANVAAKNSNNDSSSGLKINTDLHPAAANNTSNKQVNINNNNTVNNNNNTNGNSGNGSVLKLMYSLEKNSEFILLKQIQLNYASHKEIMRSRGHDQVSLQSLTRQLAYPQASSPTNNSSHKFKHLFSPANTINNNSSGGGIGSNMMTTQQLHMHDQFHNTGGSGVDSGSFNYNYNSVQCINGKRATDSRTNSAASKHRSASTNPTTLQKSILYVRKSPSLLKLETENRVLEEKQAKMSHTLENRILKTKW